MFMPTDPKTSSGYMASSANTVGNLVYGSKGYMAKTVNDWQTYMGQKREPGPHGSGLGNHYANYVDAIRNADPKMFNKSIEEGFYTCALVHLANAILALLPEVAGAEITLQRMLGWCLAPVAWLMGLPWSEAATGGALLGSKVVLNEFIAYLDLAALPEGALDDRSRLIMTYALCGFANFGSLGIMIGGLAGIARWA